MTIGLYTLIRTNENKGMTIEAINSLLSRNTLDPETRKRLTLQAEELTFWQGIVPIYPLMAIGRPYQKLLKTMIETVNPKPNETWLDAGIGPGIITKLIWEKSGKKLKKIIGLDIVISSWVEQMKKEILVLELKSGILGERLDFPDCTFDGIISNISLPYVFEFEGTPKKEGIKLLFKELSRILKPGAQLVWSVSKPNMNINIIVIGAIPDVLCNLGKIPKLPAKVKKLSKYGKELERKGREGLYTYLPIKEWDQISEEAGFIDSQWKYVFWHQTLVNSIKKK